MAPPFLSKSIMISFIFLVALVWGPYPREGVSLAPRRIALLKEYIHQRQWHFERRCRDRHRVAREGLISVLCARFRVTISPLAFVHALGGFR